MKTVDKSSIGCQMPGNRGRGAEMSGPVARAVRLLLAAGVLIASGGLLFNVSAVSKPRPSRTAEGAMATSRQLVLQGRRIFRNDTFGDEAFWSGALQLEKAIAGAKNGGVGAGVSPKTALSGGLKVDADALPENLKGQIKAGKVNLDDPATTLALLKLNAVVGLTGKFDSAGRIQSLG